MEEPLSANPRDCGLDPRARVMAFNIEQEKRDEMVQKEGNGSANPPIGFQILMGPVRKIMLT